MGYFSRNDMKKEKHNMSAFEKVIGYESIKAELLQICDQMKNKDVYEALGAKLPQGLLLHGDPGLGKTLMAKCFIEESGLPAYVLRKNRGSDDFIGEIAETFRKAKENAPVIVFLDDMDKFANEDYRRKDTEEYVAVQAGIDEVKGTGVFVLATANDIDKFPDSLIRAGRFDKQIEVERPTNRDADEIIRHYLEDKKVADSVDMDDLTKMISYRSCAELESILNEAAILAAHQRKEQIEMDDLLKAVLRKEYNVPDNFTEMPAEDLQRTALHEAGHLVVSEMLCPESVGLASIKGRSRGSSAGFIHRCAGIGSPEDHVLIALAGKAAVELYYADYCTDGCSDDLRKAYRCIRDMMAENATHGFGLLDVANTRSYGDTSESLNARNESVVQAALERYMITTRNILLRNRAFLEAVANALIQKKTLLFSDIQKIREQVNAEAERELEKALEKVEEQGE